MVNGAVVWASPGKSCSRSCGAHEMPEKSGVCLPAVRVFAQGTIAQDAIEMMSRRLRQGAVTRAGQGCNDGVEGVTAQLRLHR